MSKTPELARRIVETWRKDKVPILVMLCRETPESVALEMLRYCVGQTVVRAGSVREATRRLAYGVGAIAEMDVDFLPAEREESMIRWLRAHCEINALIFEESEIP